jgi:mediator of RNA polymerase II transcription subunit 13, fungi type
MPPTQDASAFRTSTENALARLRKTERQFRDNSILAALDVEARQLFTFYKKVDITAPKDQKTLLMKFGHVLRSNTCTIAYKTAARLPDLMKPEQAHLYRLFITAIVSSIKVLPTSEAAIQHIGPNLHLVELTSRSAGQDRFFDSNKWLVYRVDLQVLLSGHINLMVTRDDSLTFNPIQDHLMAAGSGSDLPPFVTIYLSPIGYIGRVSRSILMAHCALRAGSKAKDHLNCPTPDPRADVWRSLLPSWLKEHMNISIEPEEAAWLEIEVPIQELKPVVEVDGQDESLQDPGPNDTVSWKSIFWPSDLCFHLENFKTVPKEMPVRGQDPMQFVQEWVLGTGSLASATGADPRNTIDDDDEPLFADEGTFDDPEHFQPFGPPTFPASQTIYPTPSDVGMTHPTPGLSVDGIGSTPANVPGSSAELVHGQDEDMPDFEDGPPVTGTSAYYDEDLFEEMPEDTFGQGTNGDSPPDWDYFASPGATRKASRSASHSRKDGSNSRGDPMQEVVAADQPENNSKQSPPIPPSTNNASGDPTALHEANLPSNAERESAAKSGATHRSTLASASKPAPPLWQPDDHRTAPATVAGRRSSIYEIAKPLPLIPKHDSRYAEKGEYWFDPSPVSNFKSRTSPNNIHQNVPSSPSRNESSMSEISYNSADSPADRMPAALVREWTQYGSGPQEKSVLKNEVDTEKIQQDARQILDVLTPGLVDIPSSVDFDLIPTPDQAVTRTAPEHLQRVAQVLVDQMTQTCLIDHEAQQTDLAIIGRDQVDLQVDLSGINTSAGSSTVSQLANLKGEQSSLKSMGRISRLRSSQICLKRIDRPLTASLSILSFWDTLNLQPEHGSKNLTAFCVHPQNSNVRQGCLNLFQRLSDTYSACALGLHTIGQITGVTTDGLISWTLEGSNERGLSRSMATFGKALANASQVSGTVMIYMVSTDESAAAYLEMCGAFYYLFESFTKSRAEGNAVTDIQLQIIPPTFIASLDTLVVPSQTTYINLAIEVYNRLPPADLASQAGACASAVILSRSENSVRFQLTPMYGSPLERNGPCLHLAYSISNDKNWIVAVWTDELGRSSLSMAYCCQNRGADKGRPRQEIFKEMWEVSQDLMTKVRGAWRLAVAKNGYHDPAELHEWHQVFDKSPAAQKRCLLLLLSVQLSPALALFPLPNQGKPMPTSTQHHYGTPASTPQTSVTSPDQAVPATPTPGGSSFANASTPPDPGFDPSAESDLSVFDPSEESWSVVLPYGTNQSRNMTELRPALVTGYLIKRRGPKNDDGYAMIEVSLVRSTASISTKPSDSSHIELIDDLIRQYRGLVTLGATRGCVDTSRECLPWHIVTSIRGARVLEQAM